MGGIPVQRLGRVIIAAAEHGEPCKPHGTRRVIPHGASPHPRLAGILPTACASIFAGTSLTGRASGTLVRRYTSCCERGSGGTSFQVLARLGPTKTVCYWPGLEGSGLHSPFWGLFSRTIPF